jgi:hypothetical protein
MATMMDATASEMAAGNRSLTPMAVSEKDTTVATGATTSSMAGEVAAGGPAASTGLRATTTSPIVNDNIVEEPKVILGHPVLRAPGDVSLDKAMGMAHWVLNQVQDMLHRESGDINDECQHLLMWASMLRR